MASSIRFGYCAIITAKYALSQLIVRGICHVASCQYCLLLGLTCHRPASIQAPKVPGDGRPATLKKVAKS